jgi:1-acyl-sn-glycerol-3-phosphate acyltransferase
MSFIFRFFYTLFSWTIFVLAFVIHYIVFRLIPLSDKNYWFSVRLLKMSAFFSGITYEAHGVETVPLEGPFVLIANHMSLLDIVALMITSPRRFYFVAKKELLRVPILGWIIRSQGHIPVDRQSKRGTGAILAEMAKELKNGKPLLFFPEGTRSVDGKLLPFKRGPFMLALDADVPLLFAGIRGTGHLLPKKRLAARPGHFVVRYGGVLSLPHHADRDAVKVFIEEAERRIGALISDNDAVGNA